MKKLLAAAIPAIALASMAAPAHATTDLGTVSIDPGSVTSDGGLSFTFDYTHSAGAGTDALGAFLKSFTFTTPVGLVAANVSTNFANSLQDIDFVNVLLNGTALTPSGTDQFEQSNIFTFVPGGLNTLAIYYNSAGQNSVISGNVTYTPAVPEPATWAMMLLGFGMVGFGLRRRQAATPRVKFHMA